MIAALSNALASAVKDPAMAAAIEKAGMLVDYRDGSATRRQLEQERAAVLKAVQQINFNK